MSTAKKVFFWVFGVSLGLGLIVGLANLVVPDAVSVTWNDKNVEGLTGIPVAMFAGGFPGLFFGIIAAGITAIFSRGRPRGGVK